MSTPPTTVIANLMAVLEARDTFVNRPIPSALPSGVSGLGSTLQVASAMSSLNDRVLLGNSWDTVRMFPALLNTVQTYLTKSTLTREELNLFETAADDLYTNASTSASYMNTYIGSVNSYQTGLATSAWPFLNWLGQRVTPTVTMAPQPTDPTAVFKAITQALQQMIERDLQASFQPFGDDISNMISGLNTLRLALTSANTVLKTMSKDGQRLYTDINAMFGDPNDDPTLANIDLQALVTDCTELTSILGPGLSQDTSLTNGQGELAGRVWGIDPSEGLSVVTYGSVSNSDHSITYKRGPKTTVAADGTWSINFTSSNSFSLFYGTVLVRSDTQAPATAKLQVPPLSSDILARALYGSSWP